MLEVRCVRFGLGCVRLHKKIASFDFFCSVTDTTLVGAPLYHLSLH